MMLTHDLQFNTLIERLMQTPYLTQKTVQEHYNAAQTQQSSFIDYLISHHIVPDHVMAVEISAAYGLPLFDLAAFLPEQLPHGLIDDALIKKYHILPLKIRGNTLLVALFDPLSFQCFDEIRFSSRLTPEPILVEANKLKHLIRQQSEPEQPLLSDFFNSSQNDALAFRQEEDSHSLPNQGDDAPIVRFVNTMLLDAIQQGASDIHIERYEKTCRIRYRIDGILIPATSPPLTQANRLISRIKVMSNMDIAKRRLPQDGRITFWMEKERSVDFRVSTCPTVFGEKVVLRILDAAKALWDIEKLGFDAAQKALFLDAIEKPYGMVLVTGPTGSGKTVTLYTGLNQLNTQARNISTVEDPVEITVEGINQVNINPKIGLTFSTVLRAFLRQDPDTIMVGEIRDVETAEIAIKAAQTGHLVLSTLHTNDAPQTINRLMQMGLEAFNIVSAINVIVAQRLVRALCKACRAPVHYPNSLLLAAGFLAQELADLHLFQAVGCEHCHHGFRGRVAIYQVMALSETMQLLILQGASTLQLAEQAKIENVNDLRASGLNKVREGITSLDEINRVTLDT